jgi:hypothetical protein
MPCVLAPRVSVMEFQPPRGFGWIRCISSRVRVVINSVQWRWFWFWFQAHVAVLGLRLLRKVDSGLSPFQQQPRGAEPLPDEAIRISGILNSFFKMNIFF